MPIDYKLYPKNWKTVIRPKILKRADNYCEFCGVKNYSIRFNGRKNIKIILTIAHLDHDRENWEVSDDRLRALCQKCHLNYDKNGRQNRLFDFCNIDGCENPHHARGLCKAHHMKVLRNEWGYNSKSRLLSHSG